ncbi:MAG: hypothetical protein ACM3ZA_03075 [Bacillota bacterium]
MVILERLLPLGLAAAALYFIYISRLKFWRLTSGTAGRIMVRPSGPKAYGRGKPKEPRWIPIQSAIGSDRPLLPAAQLLRRNGVEARIVRTPVLRSRRLLRLVIRQTDISRAREIMRREDLYVSTRLDSRLES